MNQMNEESLFFVFAESRSRPAKRCDSDRGSAPKTRKAGKQRDGFALHNFYLCSFNL